MTCIVFEPHSGRWSNDADAESNSYCLQDYPLLAKVLISKVALHMQGALRVNRYNSAEGYVGSKSVGQDILIPDRIAMNRALDGDVVAVELLPEVRPSCHYLG